MVCPTMREPKRLLIIAFEPVVLLLVALVVLRILDYPPLDSHPDAQLNRLRYPSQTIVYRDEDWSRTSTNSHGLIGPDPRPITDRSVSRIAVLGDSFIEGLQVYDRQRLTFRLQEMLLASDALGRAPNVEVWNFGFAGDNTGNEFARWKYQVPPKLFDYVVLTVNEGDLLENRMEDVPGKFGSFLVRDKVGFSLQRNPSFHAVSPDMLAIRHRFGRLSRALMELKSRIDSYQQKVADVVRSCGIAAPSSVGASTDPAVELSEQRSAELAEETVSQLLFARDAIHASGSKVLIVAIPSANAMPAGFYAHVPTRYRLYRALVSEAHRVGLPILNTYPSIADMIRRGEDPYGFWDPGGHLNASGNLVVARTIAQRLVTEGVSTGR